MRKHLLATALLAPFAAHAQTSGSGTIDGLPYVTLTSPDGCSAAAPCQILEYLHPLGEQDKAPAQIQRYFNTAAFWAANPHTIVIAPMIPGSSSANNWGDVSAGINGNMTAAVNLVKQIEATVPTTNRATLTGGSMGAIGGEQLMSMYGPKGSQEAGVYDAGLFYDGAPYQISSATAQATLCGVPLTIVHGAADTTVSPVPDQTMAQTLSGCPGFTFISVPDFGHGTYSGAPQGYDSGTLIDQTMAAARSGATSTVTATAAPTAQMEVPTAPLAAVAVSPSAGSIESATIRPGGGSITDAEGHVWMITASGSVTEDGQYTPGGGGTSALMIGTDGVVFGQDSGHGPVNPGGWFTLAGNSWQVSADPTMAAVTTAAVSPLVVATPSAASASCAPSGAASGGFHVAGGQIIGPNGQPFIARGINMADNDMASASDVLAMFPGINFVRLAIYKYQDASAYAGFIATMTAHGTVVEFEHHVETNGATGGGGQGGIASGAWLAAESAFYAGVAKAFAGNPYVWFGTTNEPPGLPGLSQWQMATYRAIRNAGNPNPILLEISGWPGGWTNALDPSVYAQMTNVVWDPHFYGWVSRKSTDDATIAAALADEIAGIQTIQSADGIVPAIVAEFGPSTTGTSLDANGMQTVDAVISRGANGLTGSAVWHWSMQDCCNNLNSGSALTDLGQRIQMFINTDVIPPTQCQLAAAAQQGIANVAAAMAGATR